MVVNGQLIDIEIQVEDKKDYPERSLYYWAREYSSALQSGHTYKELPRVIIINIPAFPLFDCKEYHSEFRPLEVTRHTELCDKQVMHYYELPKLPKPTDKFTKNLRALGMDDAFIKKAINGGAFSISPSPIQEAIND